MASPTAPAGAVPASSATASRNGTHTVQEVESITIRFAGDSGDGMQLAGTRFTDTAAILGNDIATFPDFPAEIRAPAGTLAGVSGFQVHFSSNDIHTPGDILDALVVMNPAALKTNLRDLKKGGILIVNTDAFAQNDLDKAKYKANPLEDGSLAGYHVVRVAVSKLNKEAVRDCGLSPREQDRCKNFFALGLVYWLYERPLDSTVKWLKDKFGKKPDHKPVLDANTAALKAGYNYGETVELLPVQYKVLKAKIPPGQYRKITGNEALAIGLVAASHAANKTLVYSGYPITPASSVLEDLSQPEMRRHGVRTLQAEDEIAAIGVALGASFGGAIGVTGTSGPGICLKSEAINLAVMTELPLVILDIQRGGPSTGLPTKTEQADLLQAMFGRNGESPVAILAPQSPVDCFDIAYEAIKIATRFMCPVFVLSDGYIANGSEPWKIPDVAKLPKIEITHPTKPNSEGMNGALHEGGDGGSTYLPYKRDQYLSRPWAIPGTPGLEHRIGGIEKQDVTGNINYEPANHEHMVHTRWKKIENIALTIPDLEVLGDADAELLVIGWGGTYGSITTAVDRVRKNGKKVAQAHLRYLNPMPKNTEAVLKRFKKILVPELNSGQLCWLLRAKYLVPAEGFNKVQGRPFLVSEIEAAIGNIV
jgi:2-oxoglutarate/2-oxoacid ferredoxin oxidoreductase subunit alpha